MSIDKKDIEKYIFDPENPKQCKSYNLLLNLAKKESFTFFSPEFLQYFFKDNLINSNFDNALWDKPVNYKELPIIEKFKIYINNFSKQELFEYLRKLNLNYEKLVKYKFLNKSFNIEHEEYEYKNILKQTQYGYRNYISKIKKPDFKKYLDSFIPSYLSYRDTEFKNNTDGFDNRIYNEHFIFFSKSYFEILSAYIERSSVFITLEENIDEFLTYNQKNIKPIFLKKIEDVYLLLTVLQEDLKEETKQSIEKEEIPYLNSLEVKNFFSIKNLKLENLKDKKEIYIVGENGDGKTLLLQAITIALKGVEEGEVFNLLKSQKEYKFNLLDSNEQTQENYKNLLAYGSNRNNNCQIKEDETGYLTLFDNSLDLKNPIDWLKYLDHSEKSDKTNVISVKNAKKLLQELLNSDIDINITPDNVTFSEKGSIVDFHQLSAGYQGVITIVCDMLVRLSENQSYVENINEFQGIVLIDEVELHLHPKWKYDFMKKLRDIFPKIQFIVTTHSPTVILGASKEAVFYKIYKEDGEVNISNQMQNEGYTHNSLASSPLFDLKTITSRDYDKNISSDDYIYEKIHKVVSKRIEDDINIDEESILALIDKELENYDKD